ncbi:TolB family protein [Microbacterium indicum]|uniref:TolB family protein n=1 Tax=Microbacterium indicum TaxID=358100 RepID=UPI00041D00DC|nr:PD40 domain-containing protein [Microbacterium indicum]
MITRIRVWDRATGRTRVVHETTRHLEAPNWTADGRLVLNGDGALWAMPADGSADPVRIEAAGLPAVNNDHVLAPDGETIYASADDFHIWAVPLAGGGARRVTRVDAMHFLHGVRPDGGRLAYVRLTPDGEDWWASATIRTVAPDGSDDRAVTTDPGPADGCEWTPDGEWILFNTEQFERGRAQIARVREDGSGLEQLTSDERVNWFPHPSPDGELVVYLSYPGGTTGHPGGLPVELRLVTGDAWGEARTIAAFRGGQGTINVPSWAPDSSAFAFCEYPEE